MTRYALGLAASLVVAPASAEPWIDAQVGAAVPLAAADPGLALGAGFSAGGSVRAEALARAEVLGSGGAHVSGLVAGRWYAVHPDRRRAWRPSVLAGAGWQGGYTQGPTALFGVDLDLPTGFPVYSRAGLAVRAGPEGAWLADLHVGVVGRPWAPRATPVLAGPATEAPPPDAEPDLAGPNPADPANPGVVASEPAATDPTADRWWDPATCTWVEERPAGGWRPEDGVTAAQPPVEGAAGPAGSPASVAPPTQGWLMVVARPGDRIQLGDLQQQVGPDGVARLRAAEGDVRVQVIGGGRTQAFDAAIAAGYALWLRASPPEEVRVNFAVNQAQISDADRVRVQALAQNRGSWTLRVSGSYSPEGRAEDNLALAQARANALAALLRAAGVPDENIVIAPPTPPRPGLSAAEQRAVYIQPVDEGERR